MDGDETDFVLTRQAFTPPTVGLTPTVEVSTFETQKTVLGCDRKVWKNETPRYPLFETALTVVKNAAELAATYSTSENHD